MKKYLMIDLWQKEDSHWWHVGKREIVIQMLKKYFFFKRDMKILEIGCGPGRLLEELNKISSNTWGIDSSNKAIDFCHERGLERVIMGDIENTELKKKYDIIIALDVLEHLQRDAEVLIKIHNILERQGILILSVPAYKWLWSYWDEVMGHKRRYSYSEIKKKIKSNGFKVRKISYSNFFILPGVIVFRMIKKMANTQLSADYTEFFDMPKWINLFFIWLYKLEIFLLKRLNFPFGLSILCIAENAE